MKDESAEQGVRDLSHLAGNAFVGLLGALSNPHRLRLLAALAEGEGRLHVSLLAREVGLSRPLVHMHLKRLEAAELVEGHLELSAGGKAMKFFRVTPFVLRVTPEVVAEVARSLTIDGSGSESGKES